ncbi:hypothetical protein ACGFK1_09780 [Mycobacterium sp. NPDC048908]|uniref:effector-associated constant component EACC1 n=1 Tax=Mycobacterium sp. NPDC048908 TaxID=3364292 RepID=UPI00371A0B32
MIRDEQPSVVARLQLSGARDVGSEMASLWDWLSTEREFRDRIQPEERAPLPGEMGAVSDVLVVALGSGGAMTVLISSITAWLQSRRPEISVEVTGADGAKAVVSAKGPAASTIADSLGRRRK